MEEALTSASLRCVDDRDCAVRGRGNCTRTQFVPSFPQGDDRLYFPGNRGITGVANSSVARANWSWTPACEPKGACFTCFTGTKYSLAGAEVQILTCRSVAQTRAVRTRCTRMWAGTASACSPRVLSA
jgi:hypothetical protein